MKNKKRLFVIALGLSLFCLNGFSAVVIDAIRIQSLEGSILDDSFVRAYTSLRAGQQVQSEAEFNAAVARDVDSLRRSGRFSFVRAFVERTGEEMTLVYNVEPRLRLRKIEIAGARHVGNRKIKNQLGMSLGDYVDEGIVGENARKVETYLKKNKYPDAKVSVALSSDEKTGAADLLVTVDEGEKLRVKEILFEGERFLSNSRAARTGRFFKRLVPNVIPSNEEKSVFEDRDLTSIMQQKKTWWITPWFGTYRPELVEADRAALRDFYLNHGFLDVTVDQPESSKIDAGRMEMLYRIQEGVQYRIGSIGIDGETLYSAEELRKQIKLQTGEIASREEIDQAASAVNRYYGNRGYIHNFVKPVITTNPETKTADILFTVDEGQMARINLIEIRGNEKTRDEVIRRELAVYPGEKFHQQKVETSEHRLKNLGYFESVNNTYVPAAETNSYDLTFNVKEKKMGSFLIGAGFSSVDSLVGFAEMSHGNFDIHRWPAVGDGQKLKVRLQAGSSRNDLDISFVEPWFRDRKLALGVDLYYKDADYYDDDYELQTVGANVSLSKPFGPFLRGSVNYTLEQYDVSDVDTNAVELLDEEGTRVKSTVGFGLSRDTRDQYYLPTRGNRTSARVEFSGGPLAGDTDIYSLELKSSQFWPLWNEHVFNIHGAIRTVDSYGSDNVPIFDRLFLGGPRSLRGFEYRDVSPRSSTDSDVPIGGNSSWYTTAEYTVPLWRKVRGAVFYDIGSVSSDAFSFFDSDLNSDYGFGARFDLPMFPLRLDYAFPHITDDDNEDADGRWNFMLGYTF